MCESNEQVVIEEDCDYDWISVGYNDYGVLWECRRCEGLCP